MFKHLFGMLSQSDEKALKCIKFNTIGDMRLQVGPDFWFGSIKISIFNALIIHYKEKAVEHK
jgi:hypothetical protein